MAKGIIIILFCLFTLSAFAQINWAKTTYNDLSKIYQEIDTQTPGSVDKDHTAYNIWKVDGYNQAKQMALTVDDFAGYYYTLAYYVNGFHDGHIYIKLSDKFHHDFIVKWPNFFVHLYNHHYLVSDYSYQAKNKPPINARLIKCDHLTPNELMLKNIFPYFGNANLVANWIEYAPYLLLNTGNPFISLPKQCQFEKNHRYYNIKLHWSTMSDNILISRAVYNKPNSFYIDELQPNGIFISLPTFSANTPDDEKKLDFLVNQAPNWRQKKYIIIDLRGNRGGNADWGDQLLANLYGKDYVNEKIITYEQNHYTEWRVSKNNIAYLKNVELPYIKKVFGENSDIYHDRSALVKEMEKAYHHHPLVRTPTTKMEPLFPNGIPKRKYDGNLFLITDGRCGSSCLTFLDHALILPHVYLVGHDTNADTNYTEERKVELPSKIMKLAFPMKLHRNRKRRSNQAYQPNYYYYGDINDTNNLIDWITEINQRLNHKKNA